MAIFAVTNQKGGVGKTTTAINLSAALSAMRYQVLLVDLDPQCNATVGSGVVVDKSVGSLSEVLLGQAEIQSAIQTTQYGYHILPSNHRLTAAEVSLVGKKDKEKQIKLQLAKVQKMYHYVIIDCPPTLNILTINALVAADEVIIPVQCEYYALEGLAKLLKTIDALRQTLNVGVEIHGVLRTMYDGRNLLTRQVSERLLQSFPEKVYQSVIPRNIRLAEAPSHGMPILAYDKRSQGAASYLAFAAEMIRRNKKAPSPVPMIESEEAYA
jgi:chromosome partitioning protein